MVLYIYLRHMQWIYVVLYIYDRTKNAGAIDKDKKKMLFMTVSVIALVHSSLYKLQHEWLCLVESIYNVARDDNRVINVVMNIFRWLVRAYAELYSRYAVYNESAHTRTFDRLIFM